MFAYKVVFDDTGRNVMVYAPDKAAVTDVVKLGILAAVAAFALPPTPMPGFRILEVPPAQWTQEDRKAIAKARAANALGRPAHERHVERVREMLAAVAGPIPGGALFELLTTAFGGVLPATVAHSLLSARATQASEADASAADRVRAAARRSAA